MYAEEIRLLQYHLRRAKKYLEFGSGESTKYAARLSLPTVSVENDKEFLENLQTHSAIWFAMRQGFLNFYYVYLGRTKKWGRPYENEKPKASWSLYSSGVFDLYGTGFDLVLVDGRFRVACMAQSLLRTHATVMVHDFWHREDYKIILTAIDRPEQCQSMALFFPDTKRSTQLLKDLAEEFQYVYA